jgi:hypothetical protein
MKNKNSITPIIIGGYMHTGTTFLFKILSGFNNFFYGEKEPQILENPNSFIGKTTTELKTL